MSVIIGETPKQQGRDSALIADSETSGELAATMPFSVSLWVYFDQPPGTSETHTVFWYGDTDAQSNYLVLEATKSALGGIDIEARLHGTSGSVSATKTQLTIGTWYMLTVNVEAGGASHTITLYVDDTEEDSDFAAIGSVTPANYDRFLLGVADGATNFGRFRAEHVAIWATNGDDEPLTASEIETLYDERLAPFDADESTQSGGINRAPGTAYWMLVGHWSAGVEADDEQDGRDSGLLFNQASAPLPTPPKPPLQMLDTAYPLVWSAATPVMKYLASQDLSPGPYIHPPVPPVSRLQPHFYIFNPVEQTFRYGAGEIPPYTMGNFTRPTRRTVMKRANLIGVAAVLCLCPSAGAQPQVCGLETFDAISPDYWLGVESAVGRRIERTFHVPTFIDILRSQRWDCVMIAYYYPVEPGDRAPLLEELRKHLDAGGTMAVTYPHLDEWPEFQALLGVASAVDPPAPEAVEPISPRHPTFMEAGAFGVDPPTFWPDFGDVLEPIAGDGRAIGAYITSELPVMLETRGGQLLINGLTWDDWAPANLAGRDQTYFLLCEADFDGSGSLDFFDFLAFQNAFGASDLRADLDLIGLLDLFDFIMFQNLFGAGCP
ncbi:MAG: LamG-like jellyroll fold domain-containing protein [Phycisphaerales bacterium JB039]